MQSTFPTLKTPELVSAFNDELHYPVSADDIDRPTPGRILAIYSWFFENTTNITLEDMTIAANVCVEQMVEDQDQASLRDSIEFGIRWQALNQQMVWAGIDDFNIRDLKDPQAPRVRRILSGLLNFNLFEQMQETLLDEVESQQESTEKERVESAELIKKLQLQIAERKRQLQKEEEECHRLEIENKERREKLLRLKEMEEPALQRTEKAKRERQVLQERIDNMTHSLKQHDSEITRLRGRIVQSPDRVKQTLADMANSLQGLKDELVEIDRKGRDHDQRIGVLKTYETNITAMNKLGDEWAGELERVQQTSARLAALFEARDRFQEEYRELDLRGQQLDRRIEMSHENGKRHEEDAAQKKERVRQRMAKLQEAYESIMQEREGNQQELDAKMKEIHVAEQAISDLSKQTEQEMAQVDAAYKELRNEVLTYSNKLNKALDSLVAASSQPYEG